MTRVSLKKADHSLRAPARDAQATREKLLTAAERLFVDHGFNAARVDEIAALARVNKRMIYVYFGDKEKLYEAVLRANFERALHWETLPGLGSEENLNLIEHTRRLIRDYFFYLSENPNFVRLLSWESLNGGQYAGRALMEFASKGLERLHHILRSGKRQGLFKQDLDEHKLVLCVNNLCLGYFNQRSLLQALWKEDLTTPSALEQNARFISDLVLNGVLAA